MTRHFANTYCSVGSLLLLSYLKGCRLIVCTDHDGVKRILNVTDSTEELPRWGLRMSELDFVHYTGSKYKGTDVVFLLLTTGGDKSQIENDIFIGCNTPSPLLKKPARFIYLQDNDAEKDK